MKTSSITFSRHEVAVMLPALEDMLNGIVEAFRRDRYPRRDATLVPYRGQEVYRVRRYDEEMAGHVLSCRNKLKFIGKSRMVCLNSFELAVAALAFRVVRKEKLVSKDMLASPSVAGLEYKLELHRKRAKRAAIKQNGRLHIRRSPTGGRTSSNGCAITSCTIVPDANRTNTARSSIRSNAKP